MDGDEVAQIYIKNPNDPEGPIKALKAFLRVHVKAGDSQEVNIELTPEAFHSFNDNTQTMEVRPGKYQILYGGSSDEKALEIRVDNRIKTNAAGLRIIRKNLRHSIYSITLCITPPNP